MYSLGIMSGTSLDGLDISLIKSDGEKKIFPNSHRFSQEKLFFDIFRDFSLFWQLSRKVDQSGAPLELSQYPVDIPVILNIVML